MAKTMTVAVIVTVLNEETTIESLFESLAQQTHQPAEIIFCDGGSIDDTPIKLRRLISKWRRSRPSIIYRLIIQPGNRSVGRNAAILSAKSGWIAITDAGCLPERSWLKKLVDCATRSRATIVAGYYRGLATTPLQQAIIPYVLVMPDRLNPHTFLPATRSMLMTKRSWLAVGKFDERLSDNEDYAFARSIVKSTIKTEGRKHVGVKLVFCRAAVVGWLPPTSISAFARMIFRFARGDVAALAWRPKVVLIFARYWAVIIGSWFIANTAPQFWSHSGVWLVGMGLVGYLIWAVIKNVRYVPTGWYWLPLLQVVADLAVMTGSVAGVLEAVRNAIDNQRQLTSSNPSR